MRSPSHPSPIGWERVELRVVGTSRRDVPAPFRRGTPPALDSLAGRIPLRAGEDGSAPRHLPLRREATPDIKCIPPLAPRPSAGRGYELRVVGTSRRDVPAPFRRGTPPSPRLPVAANPAPAVEDRSTLDPRPVFSQSSVVKQMWHLPLQACGVKVSP